MKEKINQIAKGIFEYEPPRLLVEPEQLVLEVEAGSTYQGSFLVTNTRNRPMKGVISSDSHHLALIQDSFQGEENLIPFAFCAKTYQTGDSIHGKLVIISDCGTRQLSVTVNVTTPSVETSMGRIRDLSQFSSLAKEAPQEAIRLFGSRRFAEIFLQKVPEEQEWYRGLLTSPNKGLAMEEFLVALHKKVPVEISVHKNTFSFKECRVQFMERVNIYKNTWGYGEYHVESDASFIEVEHRDFRTYDFFGNTYALAFVVHPEKMHQGINSARILIHNPKETVQIMIEALAPQRMPREELEALWKAQECRYHLQNCLLQYQMGTLSKQAYTQEAERVVSSLETTAVLKQNWLVQAFRVHLALLNHRENTVTAEMAFLSEQINQIRLESPVLYCAYYYLLQKWKPGEENQQLALERMQECYQTEESSPLILWFLLKTDSTNIRGNRRAQMILEQIHEGCHSPFLYMELCKLYEQSPELLLDLEGGVTECLHWGCRHQMIGQEVAMRYTYLAGRMRNYSPVILKDLYALYDLQPGEELLQVICKLLMSGRQMSSEDAIWYSRGIEANLKLTDLYEYDIYTMEETPDLVFPEKVLLYFSYNSHLNAPKKAMLYAWIIQNKQKQKKYYDLYRPMMETFARQQVLEGRISPHLAVIYEEFFREDTLDDTLAAALPKIMFQYEIDCYNSDVAGVYIRHPELSVEEFVPLVQGRAIVSLYTGKERVFLADARGNRYIHTIGYTSDKLLHLDHLAEKCLETAGDDIPLLLHLYQKADRISQDGEQTVELRKEILHISSLSPQFYSRVLGLLIHYYYENFEGELLDDLIQKMDWNQISIADRTLLIEYCGVRHCYQKGMEGILQYGYDGMDAGRLLQISTDTFRQARETEDVLLVRLAWYIFSCGKFDENLIHYLCSYYLGTVEQMVQIWKVAVAFDFDRMDFAERMLAQSLFADDMVPELYEIFYEYAGKGSNKRLIRACLKQLAYEYLVKQRELPEEIFPYFYQEVRVEENKPCLLAALKHLSEKAELTPDETVFADYNIHQMVDQKIIFGFFQRFAGKIAMPERLLREQYIEYIANPLHEVQITYGIGRPGEALTMQTQGMQDLFQGIRVKSLVLFADEVLEYTITERTMDGEVRTTDKQTIDGKDTDVTQGSSWYQLLNQMMRAYDLKDEELMTQMMESFAEKKEIVRQLMKPLSR